MPVVKLMERFRERLLTAPGRALNKGKLDPRWTHCGAATSCVDTVQVMA